MLSCLSLAGLPASSQFGLVMVYPEIGLHHHHVKSYHSMSTSLFIIGIQNNEDVLQLLVRAAVPESGVLQQLQR